MEETKIVKIGVVHPLEVAFDAPTYFVIELRSQPVQGTGLRLQGLGGRPESGEKGGPGAPGRGPGCPLRELAALEQCLHA